MKSQMKLGFAAGAVLLCAGTGAWLGCQSYEVDPVRPAAAKVAPTVFKVAQRKAPNVLLVVDRSGSMSDNPDDTPNPACNTSGEHGQSCKWQALLRAVNGAAGTNGFVNDIAARGSQSDPVRIGLLTFSGVPDNGTIAACTPSTTIRVPPAPNSAATIASELNKIVPAGGTPTTAAMNLAATGFQAVAEANRSNYIVLMTDGAPNCNDAFPADATNCSPSDPQRCPGGAGSGCFGDPGPKTGCLDEQGLVGAIKDLHDNKAISTFVIGFGAGFGAGNVPAETLEKSAIAGGTQQKWADGGNADTAFYKAASATDLQNALAAIVQQIGTKCDYPLPSVPASASAVQVNVTPDGQATQTLNPGQFNVTGSDVIIIDDALCNSILAAPADHPTVVSINSLSKQ